MAKPTQTTEWCSDASYVEPSAGKKVVGFDPGERPPAQYLDWLFFTIELWLAYLEAGALEGNHSIAGDLDVTGDVSVGTVLTTAGQLVVGGEISPAALTTNTDDYAPTGLSGATVILQDITTSLPLTGLTGGAAGRVIVLRNNQALPGTDTLTLIHESGASTAANRFVLPSGSNISIPPQGSVVLRYGADRWYLAAMGF